MKKILYSLFFCLTFILISCEEESTQDNSKVTYFVELELIGDATILWAKGIPYQEPGYKATLNGEDVTSKVEVSGNVNTNVAGLYDLNYSAINEDGFSKTLMRTVFVYDATPSGIESGIYTVSKDSYRISAGAKVSFGNNYSVIIYQIEPGKFYVSDFFGGWYDQRAGYGTDYAMTGRFELHSDNTLSSIESHVNGWGDSINDMENSMYDPATKTITWDISYTANNMIFHVVLTKS